jgi:hypothetical protein
MCTVFNRPLAAAIAVYHYLDVGVFDLDARLRHLQCLGVR